VSIDGLCLLRALSAAGCCVQVAERVAVTGCC
jgi:hypothetical protein